MANLKRATALRRVYALPRRSRLTIAGIVFALAIEACFRGLVPLSAGYLIDNAVIAHDRDKLILTLGVMAAALIAASVAGVIRDRAYSQLRGRSLGNLRQSMYERLQQLSLTFHSRTDSEDILARFSEDIGQVERTFSMTAAWGAFPLLEALLYTGLAFWLEWHVGLLMLLFWPWVMLAPRTMTKRANAASASCKDEEVRILGVVEESLTAKAIIRAFSLEHMGIALFRKRNDLLARGEAAAGFLAALRERLMGTGLIGLQLAVFLMGAWLAFDNQLRPGALVSIQLLAMALGSALLMLSEYMASLEEGRSAWSRIQEGLADPAPVLDRPGAKTLPPLQDEILLTDVKYRYDDEHVALGGVTVRLPRHKYVALVGPSGSGKSTILRLLMRFHDPDSGLITIDGHDIKAVTQASIRARMGVVLQENFVFNASIGENIRLGRPDTSEEFLVDVAKAAGVYDFAAALPQGLGTAAGSNGLQLDGETTQRLAIARALLRKPDILLLDEMASALDATQEAAVNKTLREVAKGRTVVSATHRLSSTADADHIYVFDEGKVVEQGGHFELMALNGFYARLWRKQAGFHFSSDGRHVDVDADRLKQFPILEKLPSDVLSELAPYFATETFPAGRDIVCQNDPGDKFYIIARGSVEVWRAEEQSGTTTRMAVLQDGDFFGEITLITGFPRTATVRTKTVCTCISLERGQFNRLIDGFPKLRQELSDVAVQRLRQSSEAIPAVFSAAF